MKNNLSLTKCYHTYNQHLICNFQHVLKSYAAELLVIKAYEEMGSPPVGKMKTLDLMKTVFTKLSDIKNLKVSWDKYYKPSSYSLP